MKEPHIIETELARYLAAQPQVILAFLFGSMSKGKGRPSSDVDLGVYLETPYDSSEVRRLWNGLEDLTGRDVDLVVLNDAPPGIAWAAIKGRILVNKAPKLAIELMLEKSREAEDFREFQLDLIKDRSRHWRSTDGCKNVP
ncbi:MAG TPA: nucleotidyltransferase domain-containing protein [Firmicutes bacterium]|nr:nucleotidyltransferase domain-containing protein [Bacillota bacterium]